MADEEPRGFLGRWSRRKADALQGKPLTEPAPPVPTPAAAPLGAPQGAGNPVSEPAAEGAGQPEKVLSLEDVMLLNKDSDFKPFMAGNVGPAVRNAAMKKLFADPHFNVMDGLDIYIDDYSKPDPIPEAMLRKMNGSKFLDLFADEEDAKAGKNPATALPRESASDPVGQTVAQSHKDPDPDGLDQPLPEHSSQPESSPGSGASQEDHADTDLRLQPDHAAPAPDAGRGAQ